MLLFLLSLLPFSFAQDCPKVATATERYIEVDVYPDLVKMGARIQQIPGLNLHLEEQLEFAEKKLSIYYRLWKPFDPDKETVVFLLGGPGQFNDFMDTWVPRYQPRINRYNVIMMDHRTVGCSRQMFQDHMPATAYKMRFAAADLEMIRRELQGTKPWHIDGGSYGSVLALTYTLLFPESVDKLMIWGAYSSHLDVRLARRTFLPRLIDVFPELKAQIRELDFFDPQLVPRFLRFSYGKMYSATNRQEIPKMMTTILSLLKAGKSDEAKNLLPGEKVYQAPYMQNSITCLELEPYPLLPGEIGSYSPLPSCQVFAGHFDYFHYTDSLPLIDHRTFFWQGELDPLYDPDTAHLISEKLPNDFSFLVPGLGHGIGNLRDCYNDIFFAFLEGAENAQLRALSEKDYCLKNKVR
jgi:pimeloyl-ACP methyl ester carboxylesterase